jgi:hypothetical protein
VREPPPTSCRRNLIAIATFPQTSASNQPPPLAGHDLFAQNRPLAEALEREGAGRAAESADAARRRG